MKDHMFQTHLKLSRHDVKIPWNGLTFTPPHIITDIIIITI